MKKKDVCLICVTVLALFFFKKLVSTVSGLLPVLSYFKLYLLFPFFLDFRSALLMSDRCVSPKNNARYLKCWLSVYFVFVGASELEWFEFLLCFIVRSYLPGCLTHRHKHTQSKPSMQCLEEPLLVTQQCKYFPKDLLWSISYSNYAT